jgi:Flp pilus assembly protein TadD
MVAPGNPSTYSAMGLVYAIIGRTEKAVKYIHKALMKNQKDVISLVLLDKLLVKIGNEPVQLPGMSVPFYI